MNVLKINVFLILLLHIIFVGCKKDKKENTKPVKDTVHVEDTVHVDTIHVEDITPVFPQLIDDSINQFELGLQDSIIINFTNEFHGFSKEYMIKTVNYNVTLKMISLGGIDIDTLWENNKSVKIWSKEFLPPNESLMLNIAYEWSNSDTTKEVQREFIIKTKSYSEDLPLENIISTYPIDRQYYFLQNEYPKGFFYVKRLPRDVSSLSVSFLDKEQNIIYSTGLTKNQQDMRLDFDMPSLKNKELYKLQLKNGENVIYHLDFRTSNFNSFQEKIANLELHQTFRALHIPWSQHALLQNAKITIEGFDKAEASYAIEYVEGHEYKYCNGLIQLAFNPEGNSWYNDYLYPLVFAPFSDSSFEPKYANHPNLGFIPFLAMSFRFKEDLIELTDVEIANGVTSQSSELNFSLYNWMQSAAAFDFWALQHSAVQKYMDDPNKPERISDLIGSQYHVLTSGTYKFDMNYRLPDGTISSTRTFEMIYG